MLQSQTWNRSRKESAFRPEQKRWVLPNRTDGTVNSGSLSLQGSTGKIDIPDPAGFRREKSLLPRWTGQGQSMVDQKSTKILLSEQWLSLTDTSIRWS